MFTCSIYFNIYFRRVGVPVDIFGAVPSNYFADIKPATDIPKMETWESCLNRELRLSVTHPPSNIYEQIMIWTERGIFWKFPIDNEQGIILTNFQYRNYNCPHRNSDTHKFTVLILIKIF